jgi:gas vesicle protein
MAKTVDIITGGVIGATLGIITVIVASTKTGREVLKAAARPEPKKTVVVKRQRSFLSLFDEPDVIVL